MMPKTLLRPFPLASSTFNPLAKIKIFSVRNGNLGPFSYFCSTAIATAAEPSSPSPSLLRDSVTKDSLFQRLIDATKPRKCTPKEPIPQILKQWVDEGREVYITEVRKTIRKLRQMRRYSHALQISECIQSKKNGNLTCGVAAIHLDLLARVKGLEEAERYIEIVPDDSKFVATYKTLLDHYVCAKVLDKAEAIMQKMRSWGCAYKGSYEVMLDLYFQLGKLEKLNSLVLEMEKKGIKFSRWSYDILLNAYLSASDTMGMEKLLIKMESDPLVMDWYFYFNAANGYLKAGDIGKAEIMLKKSEDSIYIEKTINPIALTKAALERRHALEVLMAQYAHIGRKDEVYLLWNLHKKPRKCVNKSYFFIIMSLLTLDDVDGAQKMLNEWFSKKVKFHIGIPNLPVTAYGEKNHTGKAEAIICSVIKMGEVPNASTWIRVALGYCGKNQMEDAGKTLTRSKYASTRIRAGILRIVSSP